MSREGFEKKRINPEEAKMGKERMQEYKDEGWTKISNIGSNEIWESKDRKQLLHYNRVTGLIKTKSAGVEGGGFGLGKTGDYKVDREDERKEEDPFPFQD